MIKKGFTPHPSQRGGTKSIGFLRKKGAGFTLIELMVAVSIFVVLLTVFAEFFVSAIQAQREALASQELIDNVSYNLEYMSRAIRMAKKDTDGLCIAAKYNYQTNSPYNNKIKFLNYKNECQEFFLQGGRLKENKNGAENYLTPAKFKVNNFTVGDINTWGQAEPLTQPKVILFLEIEELKIQTTISQRNLNVKH